MPEKNLGLNGIRTNGLCDTGTVFPGATTIGPVASWSLREFVTVPADDEYIRR